MTIAPSFWRSSCLIGVGVANLLAGRLIEALPSIQEARAIVEVTGNSYAIRAVRGVDLAVNEGRCHGTALIVSNCG